MSIELLETPVDETSSNAKPTPADTGSFPAASGTGVGSRVSINVPLKEDGSPDWEKAPKKMKARFKDLLNNPETIKAFSDEPGLPGKISPEQADIFGKMAIGAFMQINATVAAIKFRLTADEIKQCFTPDFTAYPGFYEALGRIMAKRGPEWMSKFGDELFVMGAVTVTTISSWTRAQKLGAEKVTPVRPVTTNSGNGRIVPDIPMSASSGNA